MMMIKDISSSKQQTEKFTMDQQQQNKHHHHHHHSHHHLDKLQANSNNNVQISKHLADKSQLKIHNNRKLNEKEDDDNRKLINNQNKVEVDVNESSFLVNDTKWHVSASLGAKNTTNPIREIIETMNLVENPNKKVIPLSIGDPTIFGNLKPCQQIIDALSNSIKCGNYFGYQTASGMESARDAVVDYHNRLTGNCIKRRDVILTSGCSHAIDLSICVLAQRGQNILIPRPGFPLYKTLTSVYGIEFKQYNLKKDDNWNVDLAHLESIIDNKTAAIIVNNPSNPCGSVFTEKHLLDIIDIAERYRKPIIADEIYDKFVFNIDDFPPATVTNVVARQHEEISKGGSVIDKNGETINETTNELTYTDPSIVKCPNRRYRYNGDDGPECNARNGINTNYNEQQMLSEHQQFKERQLEVDTCSQSDVEEDYESDTEDCSSDSNCQQQQQQQQLEQQQYFIPMSSLTNTVPILTCGGISKTCLIPGLRLGWVIINDKQGVFDNSVRDGLGRLTQRLMGPSSLVQGALSDILRNTPDSFYARTMQFIHKNARICYERLSRVRGLKPHLPQGTMYLMVGFQAKCFPRIANDLDFTSKLMNEQSVLVLPGACFDFDNYFRICLTVPTAIIEEAMTRIEEFCKTYYVEL